MVYNYSTTIDYPHAKAVGRSLPISMKQAAEISHAIRGKDLAKAKAMLQRVIEMKEAVAFFRFNHNIGHRRGKMGPGRYPIKASEHILAIVESAEANAKNKGLSSDKLIIKSILAQKGESSHHPGRHRGKFKRTHVEVVVAENKTPATKKKPFKKTIKGPNTP